MTTRAITALAGTLFLCFFMIACDGFDTRRVVTMDDESTFSIATDDADFLEAQREAQASWDRFVSYNNPNNCKFCNCLAKRSFTDGVKYEHMWLIPFRITSDTIWAVLADKPVIINNIEEGDTTFVTRTIIEDWVCFGPNGIPLGNFLEERIKVKSAK